MKKISIIAGPNGAGKTTAAIALIPDLMSTYDYLNADEIARGLSPLKPESVSLLASKLLIKRLREMLQMQRSFAFETTGSGTNYIKYIKEAKKKGYEIHLSYLWLSNPEIAIKRVANRVAHGGHHIPENIIRRRYFLGLTNILNYYLPLADKAIISDNSISPAKIIARKDYKLFEIVNNSIWEVISTYEKRT